MSDNFLEQMEEDSSTSQLDNVSTEGLRSIAEIARAINQKEAAVSAIEDQLKEAKNGLLKLTDEDLPSALQELGVKEFTLEDGSKVKVTSTYGAHIKNENKEEAFTWLEAHGHDGLIKNTVSCDFGRGDHQEAQQFVELASGQGLVPIQKTAVHSSTLKAWAKEQVESGAELPMELFGIFVGQRATIRRTK
jgi:hypothetical protein|tara:strand:+ start:436 stop:1008 length:573 start_codon:yes stop_codon:yes gene_type:complete